MFIFDSSPLWLLVCLIAAITLSALLYWKKEINGVSKKIKALLFLLRVSALFLIFILFLNIFLSKELIYKQKAILINLVDNSRSMSANTDSAQVKNYFNNDIHSVYKKLNQNYNIQNIYFGGDAKLAEKEEKINFDQNVTNISSALLYANKLFDKQSINGAILYSDGIYTEGFNPTNICKDINYPVYVVALGDTANKQDFAITDIRYNKDVYLNGNAVFEVNIKAVDLQGADLILQLFDNNELVYTKNNIKVDKKLYLNSIQVVIEPQTAEKHFYRFKLTSNNAHKDFIDSNNEKTCIVNVIETKKHISIFSKGAHPDIGAIKTALQDNNNYTIANENSDKFNLIQLEKTDIAILYGIPCDKKSKDLVDKIVELNIPYMLIISYKTDIDMLSEVIKDFSIDAYSRSYETAYPNFNTNFSAFKLEEEDIKVYQHFSPLTVPFGAYQTPNNTEAVFFQKINNINTTIPLIATTQNFNNRRVFIFGEGIWRWRIKNYIQTQNHTAYNNLISKLVHYLSLSELFQKFNVKVADNFFEDDDIIIDATLYNDNYELVNDEEITFSIIDKKTKIESNFNFYRTENGTYSLNIGKLREGEYNWKAQTNKHSKEGAFIVSISNPEYLDLQARHYILKNLAENTGGKFFTFDNKEDVVDAISEEIISDKTYNYNQNRTFRDIVFLLVLICLLLFTEWILRRRIGIY